jgi:CRP-like cAMP-binding protein
MAVAALKLDEHCLGHLIPLNSLDPELLDEVIANSTVERLPPGRRLFSQGETDNRTFYLLSGQLVLIADGQAAVTLKADSREAAQPVAAQQPRRVTALAGTSVTVLAVDTAVLGQIIEKSQRLNVQASTVIADDEEHEHQQALGKIALFSSLPEPHRRVLLRRMVELKASKGDVIVFEGGPAEYYYTLVSGACSVTSTLGNGDADDDGVELTAGCGFGESALIENTGYQHTVTMSQDGVLLRLSKGEFLALLVKPHVRCLNEQALAELKGQGAILLDVRNPTAFKRQHIPGSINIPLVVLRRIAGLLARDRPYIICGHHGRRATMAAFVLAEAGANASVLDAPTDNLLSI